jgi:FkbM family methyltransferase
MALHEIFHLSPSWRQAVAATQVVRLTTLRQVDKDGQGCKRNGNSRGAVFTLACGGQTMGTSSFKSSIRRAIAGLGWDVRRATPVSDMYDCLLHYASVAKVTTLIDAGANTGQFATWMLDAGWEGSIVSFEPQSSAHAALVAKANSHPRWEVAPRCALGSAHGTAEINLSKNSECSSLLPMDDAVRTGGEGLEYIGTETVDVAPLSDWIAKRPAEERFLLKLDVQGFEAEVIEGLGESISRCLIVHTEASLRSHYVGELIFSELSTLIMNKGFRCVGIRPGYYDKVTREVMQSDCTFVSY